MGRSSPLKLYLSTSVGAVMGGGNTEIIAALTYSSFWFASEPELARIGQSTEKGDCKWEKAQRGGFLTYCEDLVV